MPCITFSNNKNFFPLFGIRVNDFSTVMIRQQVQLFIRRELYIGNYCFKIKLIKCSLTVLCIKSQIWHDKYLLMSYFNLYFLNQNKRDELRIISQRKMAHSQTGSFVKTLNCLQLSSCALFFIKFLFFHQMIAHQKL